MLGHRDRDFGQVEDLAALDPGDRPARQPSSAPAAAARLMAQLPVRLGRLRQRRALVPVLPARLAAGLPAQRTPPGRRFAQPFAGRRPGGVPRRLRQPRLKLSDALPRRRQLRPRLLQLGANPGQGSLRPGQMAAQRCHKTRKHVMPRRDLISRRTGAVRPSVAGA
jgi:hypothetical protein